MFSLLLFLQTSGYLHTKILHVAILGMTCLVQFLLLLVYLWSHMMGFAWQLVEGGNQYVPKFWICDSLESLYLDFPFCVYQVEYKFEEFMESLFWALLWYLSGLNFYFQIFLFCYILIYYLLLLDLFVNACSF